MTMSVHQRIQDLAKREKPGEALNALHGLDISLGDLRVRLIEAEKTLTGARLAIVSQMNAILFVA